MKNNSVPVLCSSSSNGVQVIPRDKLWAMRVKRKYVRGQNTYSLEYLFVNDCHFEKENPKEEWETAVWMYYCRLTETDEKKRYQLVAKFVYVHHHWQSPQVEVQGEISAIEGSLARETLKEYKF